MTRTREEAVGHAIGTTVIYVTWPLLTGWLLQLSLAGFGCEIRYSACVALTNLAMLTLFMVKWLTR